MKRWIAALLALMLFALPAWAEETTAAGTEPADLFDLYDFGAESAWWTGIGIPLGYGILLTSPANLPTTADTLAISDGYSIWEADAYFVDSTGAVAVVLYDEEEHPSPRRGYPFVSSEQTLTVDTVYVRSGEELNSRLNRSVLDSVGIAWQDRTAMLMTLSGPVAVGSPLLTDANELVGMVIAEYAEGDNRYVVLSTEDLSQAIGEVNESLMNSSYEPEGYQVTVEDNLVTFDWSDMNIPAGQEGETLYLVVADVGNSYLNYFDLTDHETMVQMVLTPGRTYVSGIGWYASAPSDYPASFVVTTLPEAEPLTDYDFRSLICAFAEAPEGGLQGDEAPTPVTAVTREFLDSDRAYFLSSSTYVVDSLIETDSLLISLRSPTGEDYRFVSGWLYDPSFMAEDTWWLSLGEMDLLGFLAAEGYPAGTYELSMYIHGALADTYTFTLE